MKVTRKVDKIDDGTLTQFVLHNHDHDVVKIDFITTDKSLLLITTYNVDGEELDVESYRFKGTIDFIRYITKDDVPKVLWSDDNDVIVIYGKDDDSIREVAIGKRGIIITTKFDPILMDEMDTISNEVLLNSVMITRL